MKNLLPISDRDSFRAWLVENSETEPECWVHVKRGRPTDDENFWYIDAVEEALCFGWIDSVQKVVSGLSVQRFSPRKNISPWTELNKERVRRLERLGLMTDAGRSVLPPDMDPEHFIVDPDIQTALREAHIWLEFNRFPPLYQRVRAYNVAFYKEKFPAMYQSSLEHLIEETKRGRMYGEWNDYGRLLEYTEKNSKE